MTVGRTAREVDVVRVIRAEAETVKVAKSEEDAVAVAVDSVPVAVGSGASVVDEDSVCSILPLKLMDVVIVEKDDVVLDMDGSITSLTPMLEVSVPDGRGSVEVLESSAP